MSGLTIDDRLMAQDVDLTDRQLCSVFRPSTLHAEGLECGIELSKFRNHGFGLKRRRSYSLRHLLTARAATRQT